MNNLHRVEGVGKASVFKGDPRPKNTDIDRWWNGLLSTSEGARSRPYLYGSDAGLCARKNVLHEHNTWIPNEKSATSNAYMSIGVALENMLAESLFRADLLIGQNLRLPEMPELKISGKIDLVAFDHEGELSLFEIKSCGKLPAEPNPVHLAQIQVYAAVSGIHRCWLTYISRNVRDEYGSNIAIRTFPVETGLDVLKERLRIAALSVLASREKGLPPVPASFRKNTECHWCEYRDFFCWRERPGLGGAEPVSPMRELSASEVAALDASASELAQFLIDNSQERRDGFIKSLSLLDSIVASQRMVLVQLLDDTGVYI